MIRSFECADTEVLFVTGKSRYFANIKTVAERKLTQLHAATTLDSLRSSPGNRFEALTGDRLGQHSIRINDIVLERRGVTADTALRLSRCFGGDAQTWLNLQSIYDLRMAEVANFRTIQNEVEPLQAAA